MQRKWMSMWKVRKLRKVYISAVSASTATSCSSSMSSISKMSSLSSASASKSESEPESAVVVFLLDRLKCPQTSILSRSRKVHCNPPPKGRKRSSGERGRMIHTFPLLKECMSIRTNTSLYWPGDCLVKPVYLIVFSQCCVAYFQAL